MQLEVGDHVVQFYEREQELTESVAGYLGAAIKAGETAIVLATSDHVAHFEAALRSSGVSVASARLERRLIVGDAAETVSRFTHDGRLNEEQFEDVIGALIAPERSTGRPMRIYAEMVAVLWEAGLVGTALRVEELWNDLIHRTRLSLYCAYPAELVGGEGDIDSLVRVCGEHSALLGSTRDINNAAATFECSPAAPGAARRFVNETLRAWDREDLVEEAAVVVTELSTNVVVHAHCDFEVHLTRQNWSIRMGLVDASRDVPVLADPTDHATHGRGLVVVDALSGRWGYELEGSGKRVWADLGKDWKPHPGAPQS